MFKKLTLIFLAPFIIQFLTGCVCDIDIQFASYSNSSISLSIIDNSGNTPQYLETADSIPIAAYGIRLKQNLELIAQQKVDRSILFNSAMALSKDCPEPLQYLPLDSITSLKFISLSNFNATHPAGSDVTEYFYQFEHTTYLAISDYLSKQAEFVYDAAQDSLVVDFLLMQPPANPGAYSFEIVATLSNGNVLNAVTNPAKLY